MTIVKAFTLASRETIASEHPLFHRTPPCPFFGVELKPRYYSQSRTPPYPQSLYFAHVLCHTCFRFVIR